MNAFQEIQRLLASLTRSEKVQLLRQLASELGEDSVGIEHTPDARGEDPCVDGTQIPIWVLEQYRRLGSNEAELLRSYPSLRAEDLAKAWSYVQAHRTEIDRQIMDHEAP